MSKGSNFCANSKPRQRIFSAGLGFKCKIFAIANYLHYVCARERNKTMNNEGLQRIKEAGLKLTPQRREVYKAMQELRHATVEDIIEEMDN